MERPSETPTPYCVIATVAFGCHIRTMRVPEAWIPRVTAAGWIVVIRDSDMPEQPPRWHMDMRLRSGTNRRAWLTEADVRPDDDRYDDNGASDPDEGD